MVQSLIWTLWKLQILLAVPVSLTVILLYVRIATGAHRPTGEQRLGVLHNNVKDAAAVQGAAVYGVSGGAVVADANPQRTAVLDPRENKGVGRVAAATLKLGAVAICGAIIAGLPHQVLCLVGLLLPELTIPENQRAGLGWLVRKATEFGYITDFVATGLLPCGLLLLGFAVVKNCSVSAATKPR